LKTLKNKGSLFALMVPWRWFHLYNNKRERYSCRS